MPILPPDVTPLLYWTCAGLAVFITAVSKAGFGGGVGVLAVPLLVTINLPAPRALGMMLPILIIADLFSCWHHPTPYPKTSEGDVSAQSSPPYLRWLLVGALIGIVLAGGLLFALKQTTNLNQMLNLIVGVLCLLIVLAQIYRMLGFRLPNIPSSPQAGYLAGTLAGFLSTLAQSAGPVTGVYLLEQRLDKSRQTAISVWFYLFNNLSKIPFYLLLGYITQATLWESLFFLPLVPIGTFTGYYLHKKIDERPFNAVMYIGAALAAGWMIYKGLPDFSRIFWD